MAKTKLTFGEGKRQELSNVVEQTLGIRGRLKFQKIEWDTHLLDRQSSCGYLRTRGLIKDGHVMSLYTLNQRRGMDDLNFKKVEISLFNEKYWGLAYKIAGAFFKEGYVVGINDFYCTKLFSKEKSESNL